MVAAQPGVAVPFEAGAPSEDAEAAQPAAGTAAGDAAPSEAGASGPFAAAGIAAAGAEPPAAAAGTEAAAVEPAVAEQPEAVTQASGTADEAVPLAAPDEPAGLPLVLTERQRPAEPTAAQGPACRRDPGHLDRVGHPVPIAGPSRQAPATRQATDARRDWAVRPALRPGFAPAAHCPASDCPAGHRRVAARVVPVVPDHPDGPLPAERPEVPRPCPDESGLPAASPMAARPEQMRDGPSLRRPVHRVVPA